MLTTFSPGSLSPGRSSRCSRYYQSMVFTVIFFTFNGAMASGASIATGERADRDTIACVRAGCLRIQPSIAEKRLSGVGRISNGLHLGGRLRVHRATADAPAHHDPVSPRDPCLYGGGRNNQSFAPSSVAGAPDGSKGVDGEQARAMDYSASLQAVAQGSPVMAAQQEFRIPRWHTRSCHSCPLCQTKKPGSAMPTTRSSN